MVHYSIYVNDSKAEVDETRRARAITYAKRVRRMARAAVRVETPSGRVIFEQPAPRTINQIPKYTKVVALPDGVEAPSGKRPAYVWTRTGVAVLHDPSAPPPEAYSILVFDTNEELPERFPTAAQAGERIRQGI